jgi:hypothetical protein
VAAALSAGCASEYALPRETTALRATLDADKAIAIVKDSLKPNAEGRGGIYLASAVAEFSTIPSRVNVSGTFIEYVVNGPSNVIGRALAGDECVGPSGALEYENDSIFPLLQDKATVCGARLDLRKVGRIRVVEEDAADDISGRKLTGFDVWVHETNTRYVIVNVPGVRLPELMAALTFYSPNAKLLSGAGF